MVSKRAAVNRVVEMLPSKTAAKMYGYIELEESNAGYCPDVSIAKWRLHDDLMSLR